MNLRIVAAFFADGARQGDDARFSVIGGGLHSIEAERFPFTLDVEAVVVGLELLHESPTPVALELRLIGPQGEELAQVAGELEVHLPERIVSYDAADTAQEQRRILWVVLPLPRITLSGPGLYQAVFALNGERSPYQLPLTAAPLPTTSGAEIAN